MKYFKFTTLFYNQIYTNTHNIYEVLHIHNYDHYSKLSMPSTLNSFWKQNIGQKAFFFFLLSALYLEAKNSLWLKKINKKELMNALYSATYLPFKFQYWVFVLVGNKRVSCLELIVRHFPSASSNNFICHLNVI